MTMEWDERFTYVQDAFAPWIETTGALQDALVVDFGCGTGAVNAPSWFGRPYLGLDVEGAVKVDLDQPGDPSLSAIGFWM